MSSDQREQFEFNMRQFIRNEVETGVTFASLALGSSTEEARQRTGWNARKAYDTANHFLNEHPVGALIAEPNLLARLTTLRDLLLQLGETFEE
jgi:hypothetical protein